MAAEEIRGTKQRIAYTVMIVRDFGEAHHLPPPPGTELPAPAQGDGLYGGVL